MTATAAPGRVYSPPSTAISRGSKTSGQSSVISVSGSAAISHTRKRVIRRPPADKVNLQGVLRSRFTRWQKIFFPVRLATASTADGVYTLPGAAVAVVEGEF